MKFKKSMLAMALAASTLLAGCNDNDSNNDVKSDVKNDTKMESVRFATFNLSFDRDTYNDLVTELGTAPAEQNRNHQQPRNIAETIQRVRPDVVLLNEFNNDGTGSDMQAIDGFRKNYLTVSQNGSTPIDYPYAYNFATNTGKQITGMDLDKDGKVGGPDDAIGFGQYHGQYAFTVLSRYPLDTDNMRTFQNFKWKDIRATNPVIADKESCNAARDKKDNGPIYNYCLKNIGNAWYTEDEWNNLPLSSKNHVDLPVNLPNNKTVHFLVSHPAPPIFDNPIKHNTLRNADEVKFWVDYISGNPADNTYIYDDNGTKGGLAPDASFVIAGDMNADAHVGDGDKGPINNLLSHERINQQISSGNTIPTSSGAVEYVQLGVDSRKPVYPESITNTSNLHLDHVLPSSNLNVTGSGVFWPASDEPYHYLVKKQDCKNPTEKSCYGKEVASDHRMVWVDLKL